MVCIARILFLRLEISNYSIKYFIELLAIIIYFIYYFLIHLLSSTTLLAGQGVSDVTITSSYYVHASYLVACPKPAILVSEYKIKHGATKAEVIGTIIVGTASARRASRVRTIAACRHIGLGMLFLYLLCLN